MINEAVSHNLSKPTKRKSLKDKLVSKRIEMSSHCREDTQIILLDSDQAIVDEKLKVIHSFEKALEKWNSYHSISTDASAHAVEKYEEILLSLVQYIKTNKAEIHTALSVKSLIDNSKAKDILLGLNRIDRKKIYKRLESLINHFEPIHWSFRDQRVQKIIIGENIKFQLDLNATHKSNIFIFKHEIDLLKQVLSLVDASIAEHGSGLLDKEKKSILVTQQVHTYNSYILKRVSQKAPNLLDLMREKMISLEHGNFAIKYIKKFNAGLIINGSPSTGKTRLIIALASSIASSKNIAISGNLLEYKSCLKDFMYIKKQSIINTGQLDSIAQEIAQSGISVFIADDSTTNDLALAWILHSRHAIPSIVSITGKNSHNTLYHSLQNSMRLLNHDNNQDFFYWNFTSAFPLFIDLNKTEISQQAILQNVSMKSNIPCLEPSDIRKLSEHT